jgi:hypothetical protein
VRRFACTACRGARYWTLSLPLTPPASLPSPKTDSQPPAH